MMRRRPWWGIALGMLLLAAASGLLLSACGTAPDVLTSVLGPPLAPQAVHFAQRRPEYKPWEEFTMDYNPVAPEKTNWKEKLEPLEKYDNGDINWVKALNDGLIKPKPGLKDDAEDLDTEDAIVELVPEDSPDDKAVYPHLPHTQILACKACHPKIFKKRAGADPITMKKIRAGEYCGVCHGKVAFDVKNCDLCHPPG